MTGPEPRARAGPIDLAAEEVSSWADPGFVSDWIRQDGSRTLLDLPRRIAAEVVAAECEPVGLVVDVASGAGTFLRCFLDRFPDTRGVWSDSSAAMERHARVALAATAARTTFAVADMRNLGGLGLGRAADVVLSSRGSHHLEDDELRRFYADCARMLRPGGWVVNLDHVGTTSEWDRRWRATRAEVTADEPQGVPHPHRDPLASEEIHRRAIDAAGFIEFGIPWRALQTTLFMARAT